MGKKGLSLEEKRQKILEIYYEKKEVFNLKEIEKLGAKKGVVFQTIKDVNQSLVDDNLVETDKIGSGAFFWALPSKGYQSRKNLIDNLAKHIEEVKQQVDEVETKIKQEREARVSDDGDRERMMQEMRELQRQNADLTSKVKMFEKCDPKRMEELSQKKKVCKEGMIRWTDNLYEMENWIKRNNAALTSEELYQAFPILKDLDYLE